MNHILAFDCGGTGTRAGLYTSDRKLVRESEGGPSNPAELGVDHCVALLAKMGRSLLAKESALSGENPIPSSEGVFPPGEGSALSLLAAGVAGALNQGMRQRIADGLGRLLKVQRVMVSDDRYPMLQAQAQGRAAVVVIAGTGSSISARSAEGQIAFLGGRGRLMGDEGSACTLALRALRACARGADGWGPDTMLAPDLVRAAGCKDLAELALWSLSAHKNEIADLAKCVTRMAEQGDGVAKECVKQEAAALAEQTRAAMKRLDLPADTPLFYHGGLIQESVLYQEAFRTALGKDRPRLDCKPASLSGHGAVLEMACQAAAIEPAEQNASPHAAVWGRQTGDRVSLPVAEPKRSAPVAEQALSVPVTEQALITEKSLDQCTALEMVRFMNDQDATVPAAVAREEENIAKTMEEVARAFSSGGRLIYVGAGTSGRLGVLDASECPPTFGIPPEKVVAIMAGGDEALRSSREDAEDDPLLAAADLAGLTPLPGSKDVVVGITASGTTPYVLAAVEKARALGARTVLLCCNPACKQTAAAHRVIALPTGPEVLAGSTRLKAGTATKQVLNMITTGAMALSGHIHDGLMVGMQPLCAKLRRRAVGIVKILTGTDDGEAKVLLKKADHQIPVAVLMARKKITAKEAGALLHEAGGSLRQALDREGGSSDP